MKRKARMNWRTTPKKVMTTRMKSSYLSDRLPPNNLQTTYRPLTLPRLHLTRAKSKWRKSKEKHTRNISVMSSTRSSMMQSPQLKRLSSKLPYTPTTMTLRMRTPRMASTSVSSSKLLNALNRLNPTEHYEPVTTTPQPPES